MQLRRLLAPALVLLAPLACGGGSGSHPESLAAPATVLSYVDPGDPGQWRLVKNPSSTPGHLILNLLAPSGVSGMGVTLVLTADSAHARWSGAPPVVPGNYVAPLIQRASVSGADLRLVLSQENPTQPLLYGTSPVLSVALDLVPGAPPGAVALRVSQAGHLPAPMNLPVPISVSVGALEAR